MAALRDEQEGVIRPAQPIPGEPEKLTIPEGAVGDLIQIALRSQEGNAWFRGFITAHGEPEWIVGGAWAIKARSAEVVKAPPEAQQPRAQTNGRR